MIEKLTHRVFYFFETQAFGVCAYIGEKFGIATYKIRLFFIYASFITIGSPLLIYLGLAFLLDLRNYLRRKKLQVWDL